MSERNWKLSDLMPEHGDMLLVIRDGGRTIFARVRHGDQFLVMPVKLELTFAPMPSPPRTPIRAVVRAGWTQREWRSWQDD